MEDDAAVRAATESLVKSLGFLQSHRVAETVCLISDVQMPNMSGVELQANLADRGFRIPTIFMTAFPDESVKRRAMDAGAVGFLHKPFNAKALIQCIQGCRQPGRWSLRAPRVEPLQALRSTPEPCRVRLGGTRGDQRAVATP
jgi:FixJ family two-component response regulator